MTKEEQLRSEAKRLLADKKVDIIIGYAQGTLPCRTMPIFIRDGQEADKLVWNQFCENNLANYLPQQKGRVGIVAKGCDVRAIIGYLKEKKITREQVVIIGVGCDGIIDRKKIKKALNGQEIIDSRVEGERLIIKGKGFEKNFDDIDEYLHDSCHVCFHKNPVIYDILIGEKSEEQKSEDEFKDIEDIEKMSMDERWAYFNALVSKCIRCYACRNACPLCYCAECIVDQTQPQWFGKTDKFSDTFIYHLVRAYHSAGRCLDCGACVRACPVGINLRSLTKKLEKDIRELYGYTAGESLEDIPPLSTYKQDDPQGCLTKP